MKPLHLVIDTMEAVLVEYDEEGRVRLEGEEWTRPGLQERRAIIHAAREEILRLEDLVRVLETSGASSQ